MLRAFGRKNVELKIRMCNFTERKIDHSIVSTNADARVNHSSAAKASVDYTRSARSKRDFLKSGGGISACVCDGRV